MPPPDQDSKIRASVEQFRSNLEPLIDRARARTIARLGRELKYRPDGRIDLTAANQRVLRRVDRMFLEELDKGGYNQTLDGFVASFPGQLPDFREALRAVGVEDFTIDRPAQASLAAQQASARQVIRHAVDAAARSAQAQAMLTVGGIPYEQLAADLSRKLGASVGRSESLANTAMASYYRLMVAHADEQLPGAPRYKFANVIDRLTRPWCRRMVERSKKESWTKAEIDGMTNGTALPCFLAGGGWNCRGTWLLDSVDRRSSQ